MGGWSIAGLVLVVGRVDGVVAGLRAGQTRGQGTGSVCKGKTRTKRLETNKLVVSKRVMGFWPNKDTLSSIS